MKTLVTILLVCLVAGQVGAVPILPGVVVYAHDIVLVILFIESFVQYAIRGKLVYPKLLIPILLFVLAAIVSLLANSGKFPIQTLGISSLYLVRFVLYACVYVVVIQRFVTLKLWIYGLFLTGVTISLLGFVQFYYYPDLRNLMYLGWDPHYYRLFSTFLDPNFVGIYVVLTILLGLHLLQLAKYKVGISAGIALSVAALLLTYSRGSYLAFVVGIGTYLVLTKKYVYIIGLILFIAAVFMFPKIQGSTLELTRSDSTFARIANWQASIVLFSQAPLFGHGFNTLRFITPDIGEFVSKASAGVDSSLLYVMVTTGLLGLAAFVNLIYRMVVQGKKAAWYLSSLAALGVHSLFINSAFYPWMLIWMWIITAYVGVKPSGGTRSS